MKTINKKNIHKFLITSASIAMMLGEQGCGLLLPSCDHYEVDGAKSLKAYSIGSVAVTGSGINKQMTTPVYAVGIDSNAKITGSNISIGDTIYVSAGGCRYTLRITISSTAFKTALAIIDKDLRDLNGGEIAPGQTYANQISINASGYNSTTETECETKSYTATGNFTLTRLQDQNETPEARSNKISEIANTDQEFMEYSVQGTVTTDLFGNLDISGSSLRMVVVNETQVHTESSGDCS